MIENQIIVEFVQGFVKKFFFECNAFSSLCVCACGTYLHMNNSHRTNLDVVLLNAQQNLESYTEDNGNCSFFF